MKKIPLMLIIISTPTIFVSAIIVAESILLQNGVNDGIIYGTPLLASGILLLIVAMQKNKEVVKN